MDVRILGLVIILEPTNYYLRIMLPPEAMAKSSGLYVANSLQSNFRLSLLFALLFAVRLEFWKAFQYFRQNLHSSAVCYLSLHEDACVSCVAAANDQNRMNSSSSTKVWSCSDRFCISAKIPVIEIKSVRDNMLTNQSTWHLTPLQLVTTSK